jgi:hypothetical protein
MFWRELPRWVDVLRLGLGYPQLFACRYSLDFM